MVTVVIVKGPFPLWGVIILNPGGISKNLPGSFRGFIAAYRTIMTVFRQIASESGQRSSGQELLSTMIPIVGQGLFFYPK